MHVVERLLAEIVSPVLNISATWTAVLPSWIVSGRCYANEQIDIAHDLRKDKRWNLF